MSLYIMRHGRTDWNEEFRLQGQTDIPLNDVGRQMALNTAEMIPNINFDVCFCSPLQRAIETANICLKDKNVEIIIDDRLKELGFGIDEGTKKPFTPGSNLDILFQTPEKYKPSKDGENLSELFERTSKFLNERVYPLTNLDKNVLIVGHGAMNCAIISQIKHTPITKFWTNLTDNCVITQLM